MKEFLVGMWVSLKNWKERMMFRGFKHLNAKQAGFTHMMYRGKPVVERDDVKSKVGFFDRDKTRIRLLNWKTGKAGKTMSYDEFEAWIIKENKRMKKLQK